MRTPPGSKTRQPISSHCRFLVALALLFSLTSTFSSSAWADQPDRELPDYYGREDPPPDAGDVLIWVPKVVLFPVYLVTEYLVRWPIGALATWVERERVIERAAYVLSFGGSGSAGFFPTAFIEFGFRPSIGLYLFVDELVTEGDKFRFHFAWGGSDWWRVTVRERFPLSAMPVGDEPLLSDELSLNFVFSQRPDYIFHGIGPAASEEVSRYFLDQIGGSLDLELIFSELNGIALGLHVERNDLGPGDPDENEVPIDRAFDVLDDSVVPGYEGFTLGLGSFAFALDSRPVRPAPGTGARLIGFGDLGVDFANTDRLFLRYGGEMGLFLDLTGRNRNLGLRQYIAFTENLGDEAIPFTELVALGGHQHLRGFYEGRYVGESAFVTTLQYSFPIWVFLDGLVFFDVGNVFGHNLSGFDVDLLASSFGLGVRTNGERDVSFDILVGAGTTPFGSPTFEIDSARFLIGATQGF